jgi:signal transduction histidine kinase
LLEDLLTRSDLTHLMLIGAYRDNEVDRAHPLMRKLDAIRQAGAQVQEIRLAPLARDDLRQVIVDALCCGSERAAPLARLVHEKTGGNPFFALQFISALAEEGLLHFDHDAARWRWDIDRLHAKGYTDNVVDLMVGKLARLPVETRAALQQLACLGNVADVTMLAIVLGKSIEDVHSDLWEAVRLELVERVDGAYKFMHDRVHEAAYSLIPERSRAEAHLRIGRLLAAHTAAEKREEAIFEVVNQLNRGAALITAQGEREQLAELNLLAGQRAKAATAYASALTYLTVGADLLPEDSWERRHPLSFALALHRGECEFLTGALAEAEQRLAALSTRAADSVERATVACLRLDLYTTLDQSSRAIAVGLECLRHQGIDWSPHPTEEEARHEYERVWSQLGGRTIETLIELPLMRDPASLATMDVLTKLKPPATYTDANLLALVTCHMVNLSLERGNCDASCGAYVWLSTVAGPRFGDYRATVYRFGELGYDLVEGRELTRFQARTYMDFGSGVVPWIRHVRAGRDLVRRAFEAANKNGDLTYAAYCGNQMNTNFLAVGDPLAEAEREAEHGLAFARKARIGLVIDLIASQLGLIRTLRGLTPTFGSFDDEQFEERGIEHRFSDNPDLAIAECWYWIRKLQARFFAGDYASAIEASSTAGRLLWASLSSFETAEYHFYGALSQAAACDFAAAGERRQHLDAVAAHHRQLQLWAANCPDNFENRAALVGAEIARIDDRDGEAMRLYEQAIRSARANGFAHQEALAYELAARFYAARGFEEFAYVYLRNARYGYRRWGADGKVRQLDEMYPQLRGEEPAPAPTSTIGTPVEHLDLATVIKVSQTVSGEIVLEKLLDTLMRTAIAHAGAERGLLILSHGEPRIEAEATTGGDTVLVQLRDQPMTAGVLPKSVIHYVLRTRESVILDDATAQSPFAADPYLGQRQVRSVLCLPLITQARPIGVLYLENSLASHVFTPARISVLKLLASQAAIALENARLYAELINENRDRQRAEDELRRSEESLAQAQQISHTGSWRWNVGSGEVRWSTEHFRIFSLDPQTEWPSYATFMDRVHLEDRPAFERAVDQAVRERSRFQHEYRIALPDGSIKYLQSVGQPDSVESDDLEFVGTVMDITERRRAEEALRNAEAELIRVARLTTMGELLASIAHEINQPLAAVATSGNACLRWLNRDQPDLDAARDAASRIVRDAHRAGDVIRSLRALTKKSGPQLTELDINGAIHEVLALTHSELQRHGIVLHTDLSADGRPVFGDRVQLQQVLLNLITNAADAMSTVMDHTRELTVSSALIERGGVLVTIEDTGAGLDPTIAQRIFEPFFTTKSDGLGMGLSICRSIIESHGGQLWVSPNVPYGTVFRFTVPGVPPA